MTAGQGKLRSQQQCAIAQANAEHRRKALLELAHYILSHQLTTPFIQLVHLSLKERFRAAQRVWQTAGSCGFGVVWVFSFVTIIGFFNHTRIVLHCNQFSFPSVPLLFSHSLKGSSAESVMHLCKHVNGLKACMINVVVFIDGPEVSLER